MSVPTSVAKGQGVMKSTQGSLTVGTVDRRLITVTDVGGSPDVDNSSTTEDAAPLELVFAK